MKFYMLDVLTSEETEITEGFTIIAKEGNQRLFEISGAGYHSIEVNCWTGGMAIYPAVANVVRIEARRK